MNEVRTPQEIYDSFWKDIVEDKNGNINKEQLIKELSDFYFIMEEVPKVYCEFTGLSKLMYSADTVINEINKRYISKELTCDDLINCILKEYPEVHVEIKEYFDQ